MAFSELLNEMIKNSNVFCVREKFCSANENQSKLIIIKDYSCGIKVSMLLNIMKQVAKLDSFQRQKWPWLCILPLCWKAQPIVGTLSTY